MTIYRVPVNITYTGAGSPGVNVWHIRSTDPWLSTPAQLQANVTVIRTFYDALKALFPSTVVFTLGTVTDVETQEEAVPTFASVTGTGAVGYAPQALAIVVTWKTVIAARRGRGRTFLGPMSSGTMQTDGSVTDANLTTIRTAATALVTSSLGYANGAIGVWGVTAPRTDPAIKYKDLPHTFRDVTSATVRDIFGVLRSRRD